MESPAQGDLVFSLLGSQGEDGATPKDGGLNFFFFFATVQLKKNQQQKSTISNPLMFGYRKSAITLFLFSFLEKFCVQAFLSLGMKSPQGVSTLCWPLLAACGGVFFFFLLTENECDQKLLKL